MPERCGGLAQRTLAPTTRCRMWQPGNAVSSLMAINHSWVATDYPEILGLQHLYIALDEIFPTCEKGLRENVDQVCFLSVDGVNADVFPGKIECASWLITKLMIYNMNRWCLFTNKNLQKTIFFLNFKIKKLKKNCWLQVHASCFVKTLRNCDSKYQKKTQKLVL